jgi:outer membrane protein TolC
MRLRLGTSRRSAQDAQSLRDIVARRVDAGESPEVARLRTRVEALQTDLEARAAKAEAEGLALR